MFLRSKCVYVAILIIAGPLVFGDQDSAETRKSNVPQEGKTSISQIDYVLQPYDLIQIVVFQETDLERQVRLSEDSKVSLPLIGLVDLKGKTIGAAQAIVSALYNNDYLVNPQVNITVLEYSKETVNVLGAVNLPGAILIPPDQPLNLIDAITRAGGFSRLADRKHVKLTRLNSDQTTSTVIINADDIIQSTSSDSRRLQKGDVIYVPERIL